MKLTARRDSVFRHSDDTEDVILTNKRLWLHLVIFAFPSFVLPAYTNLFCSKMYLTINFRTVKECRAERGDSICQKEKICG
jgi:hypothetical protein